MTEPVGLSERSNRLVVSAFPATGKTYLAERHDDVMDSDSSDFHWEWRSPETRVPHRNWPLNYVDHIAAQLHEGRTVLCSTHQEIRDALSEAHVPYLLVYPRADLRSEYVARVRARAKVMRDATEHAAQIYLADKLETSWLSMLRSLQEQKGCVHVELGPGEYLRWPL